MRTGQYDCRCWGEYGIRQDPGQRSAQRLPGA
jgi:hypothetical protein